MSRAKEFLLKNAAWAARMLPDRVKRWLYRTPFLARFARRTLNAAAPKGLNEVTIAAGALQGMRMTLDLQSEKDYWLGTYEPDLQAAAHRLIQPGMVVYDVGANIGYISLMASKLIGDKGKVFAFEALPGNVERLTQNVSQNEVSRIVSVVHAAVSERSGEAVFLVHESGSMGKTAESAGRLEHYASELRVPALALDDFIYQSGNPIPQVVKMDIEGGEGMALRGMKRILEEARPVLMIELHGQEAAQQVWGILTRAGYQIFRMGNDMPQVRSLEELDWKAYIVAKPGK